MFFRANTVEKAKKLGVVGHVENTSRGTVTGEVQGEPKPVSLMKVSICFQAGQIIQVTVSASVVLSVQNWLQSEGPSGARIDKCSFSDASSDLDKLTYSSFEKH